jgi:hypothetical protein
MCYSYCCVLSAPAFCLYRALLTALVTRKTDATKQDSSEARFARKGLDITILELRSPNSEGKNLSDVHQTGLQGGNVDTLHRSTGFRRLRRRHSAGGHPKG